MVAVGEKRDRQGSVSQQVHVDTVSSSAADERPLKMGSQDSLGSRNSDAKSRGLRGNLTRTHQNRDPFERYEILETLGSGSMGSVQMIRKRGNAVGFSARINYKAREAEEEKWENCFQLPLIGNVLQLLLGRHAEVMIERASRRDAVLSDKSSHTVPTTGSSSDDPSSSTNNGTILAMKSVHLKFVNDPVFVQELENEIMVLKTLDHPNIVKVMETYTFDKQLFVVMELCSGGDLYTRDPYTEPEAARHVSSILSAVAFMHSRNV